MIPVGHGDQLLLYTDGVSEARDAACRFFPLAQVTADGRPGPGGDVGPSAAAGADRTQLLDALVTSLDDHVGDRRSDDILLLLVTMRLPRTHRHRIARRPALRVCSLLSPGRRQGG